MAKSSDIEEVMKLRGKDEELAPDIIKIGRVLPVAGPTGVVITDEGLVVVDTGMPQGGVDRVRRIRERTQAPFHTIIYSHGHGDHVGGVHAFLEDAEKRGHPRPRIIGHELVAKRFDKYQMLAGRRQYIGSLQFPSPEMQRAQRVLRQGTQPSPYVYPNITFTNYMEFKLGGLTFELRHAPAETDDTIWVWVPERKLAMIGDLLIGGCPNTGNPLKEQRYTLEWAEALEKIADKNPEFIIAGLGVLRGKLARERCLKTAEFLRYIHNEVVKLLNERYWIEDILEKVNIPEEMANDPWLAGNYGYTTFIIHDVYRRYTGWYDGNPSELFPSRSSNIAAEITKLSSTERLIERARELQKEGDIQLALHVVDFAIKGTDDVSRRREAVLLKADLLEARGDDVRNFIAGNIMRTSAHLLRQEAGSL
jgi:alkyl sulfatase BDS1-like metallo-beta-lactamase superfamily hydrolase